MTSVTFNVPDISCEHCQRAITSALLPVEGIDDVRVDIPTKQVHVTYDPNLAGIERMHTILARGLSGGFNTLTHPVEERRQAPCARSLLSFCAIAPHS